VSECIGYIRHSHTHTHTYTHMHTRTFTHSHARTHIHALTLQISQVGSFLLQKYNCIHFFITLA